MLRNLGVFLRNANAYLNLGRVGSCSELSPILATEVVKIGLTWNPGSLANREAH